MNVTELSVILGAMFSGMGLITAAFFKGFSLLNGVGKKVEATSEIQVDKLDELRKELKLELASIHNDVSMMVAKINWSKTDYQKTKDVIEVAIDKMKLININQLAAFDEKIESNKKQITSELVRIIEQKKEKKQ